MNKSSFSLKNELKTIGLCGAVILAGCAVLSVASSADKAAEYRQEAKERLAAKQQDNQPSTMQLAEMRVGCDDMVRDKLQDPNSYTLVNRQVKLTNDKYFVKVDYTATNAFGGKVRGAEICTFTL